MSSETSPYNPRHLDLVEESEMPKTKKPETTDFGTRLVRLREAAGYTQLELADEIGVSRRMIAYYEGQSDHPPTTLLPAIATALGTTTDELLGATPIRKTSKAGRSRLQRRLQQLEKLAPREKRLVLQLLDTFIERDRLKRQAG